MPRPTPAQQAAGMGLVGASGTSAVVNQIVQFLAEQEAKKNTAINQDLASRRVATEESNAANNVTQTSNQMQQFHELMPIRQSESDVNKGNLGLRGQEFGQHVTEYNAGAADRSAETELKKAQATHLLQPTAGPPGSDFKQFLDGPFARSIGKTPDQLTSDDVVAARKKFGQADDTQRVPMPFVLMGPNGPIQVDRTTGTSKPITDVSGAAVGKAASPAVTEKLAGLEQGLSILDELKSLKKDEWIGPLAGRLSQAKFSIPGIPVDEDLAKFSAQTSTLKNAVVKAITGAQMSEPAKTLPNGNVVEKQPDGTWKVIK